jgi:hypothetical protein
MLSAALKGGAAAAAPAAPPPPAAEDELAGAQDYAINPRRRGNDVEVPFLIGSVGVGSLRTPRARCAPRRRSQRRPCGATAAAARGSCVRAAAHRRLGAPRRAARAPCRSAGARWRGEGAGAAREGALDLTTERAAAPLCGSAAGPRAPAPPHPAAARRALGA